MPSVTAHWNMILLFSGSLGYAIHGGMGCAVGLAIASGVAVVISFIKG